MAEISRRGFLASGAGAAAAGVAVAALPALGGEAAAATLVPSGAGASVADVEAIGAWVVHIRDASDGEVSVFTGESEHVFHDPALVARIIAAAGRGE